MSATDLFTVVSPTGLVSGREAFEFANGDLVDDDLQEMVTLSLFTWRRALASDPVAEGGSRQGWFADAEFGSRLWLLQGGRITPALLSDARRYAEEALAWMVADRVVGSVTASAELAEDGRRVYLAVELTRPLQPEDRIRYAYLWSV